MGQAVREAGGQVVPIGIAEALVWFGNAQALEPLIAQGPLLRWIQLPVAGVERYLPLINGHSIVWTAAKGVYDDSVAEQALGLAIAGYRNFISAGRYPTWRPEPAKTLFKARVTIVGAGGIAQSLIKLLRPFAPTITVVRRRSEPTPGADATVAFDRFSEAIPDADLIVLAAALTPQTERMVAEPQLRAMKRDAWLINVARGKLIKTDHLVRALQEKWIGGAGLDVTDPEPLPDGHPLWRLDNCLITSHTANPPNLERAMFRDFIVENVGRFVKGERLLGEVDRTAGY
jgi:phosphoglycerate dehydrogenase-like enzyme